MTTPGQPGEPRPVIATSRSGANQPQGASPSVERHATPMQIKQASVRRDRGFRHIVAIRHHTLSVDEPVHLGGSDSAPSPLELLAAALGSCISATIAMYFERKRWQLPAIEVDVEFAPPGKGGSQAHFHVRLRVGAGLAPDQLERLEAVARACPVRRTLTGAAVSEEMEVLP